MAGSSRVHRAAAVAVALVIVLVAAGCEPVPAWKKVPIAGFTPVSSRQVGSLTGDQGPASLYPLSGKNRLIYGGEFIDKSFKDDGWTHLGDPDSLNAFIAYPYQASDPSMGKMYDIVTPHGRSFRYTHALDAGEEYNNSFATISPDGQYLVSGEWDTESRLIVFPMPIMNHSVGVGNLPLARVGDITLSQSIDYVQGCDFVSSTRLICASDDDVKHLWNVALSAPLSGAEVTGTVTSLGTLPQVSEKCPTGNFEAEGLDYDPLTKLLRVQVIPPSPCFAFTDQYTYKKK